MEKKSVGRPLSGKVTVKQKMVSLYPDVIRMAQERAKEIEISFSAYVSNLIIDDCEGEDENNK